MLYRQEEVNLHTHSFYCKHGTGTIKDYVDEAERLGNLRVLGFSEHCPLPDRTLHYSKWMDFQDLVPYQRDIEEMKSKTDIVLLTGAECDAIPEERNFYEDDLLGSRKFDYLLCSVHAMPDPCTGEMTYIGRIKGSFKSLLSRYVKEYTDGLRSGIFLLGCHPDLFLSCYREWDAEAKAAAKDIIQCAIDCRMPIEMNGCGYRKPMVETSRGLVHQYPVREFWEMARDMGAMITVNSDAHNPDVVQGLADGPYLSGCHRMAAELGIEFVSWEVDGNGIRYVPSES